MISEDQISQIKSQIISQINSNFPEDKKASAIEQINLMNKKELEDFLVQNNLISKEETSSVGEGGTSKQECVFCAIVKGKMHSEKVAETKEALAVLEINPISRGHTIIIPKEHITSAEKIPKSIIELSQKLAKKIKEKLKSKEIKIQTSNLFGHEIINIFPIYKDENFSSQRNSASKEELEQVLNELNKKEELIKEHTLKKEAKLKVPERIP